MTHTKQEMSIAKQLMFKFIHERDGDRRTFMIAEALGQQRETWWSNGYRAGYRKGQGRELSRRWNDTRQAEAEKTLDDIPVEPAPEI